MGLINHTRPISHHITPLVINALKGKHTDRQTDTHILTCKQNRFQKPGVDGFWLHVPGLKTQSISIEFDCTDGLMQRNSVVPKQTFNMYGNFYK